MSTFNAIGVAGSGVTVYRKWLDAVSDNIANIDNVSRTSDKAFQARYVVAQEAADGNGAQVGGVAFVERSLLVSSDSARCRIR